MAVIVATILHDVCLTLDPPGYLLTFGLNPLLRLEKRFHLRVVERRHEEVRA